MNSIDIIEDISEISDPYEFGLVGIRDLTKRDVLKLSDLHNSLFGRSELNESLLDIKSFEIKQKEIEGDKTEVVVGVLTRSVRNLSNSEDQLSLSIEIPKDITTSEDEEEKVLNLFNKTLNQGTRSISIGEDSIYFEDLHDEFLSKLNDIVHIEGRHVIDILRHGTSDYTNIVNLNPYLSDFFGKSFVQMGVKFVMNGLIYAKEINFSPVELVDGVELVTYDFQQDIFEGKVTVECLDRVIRVFGNVPEITECIIDHLYFHYGNI